MTYYEDYLDRCIVLLLFSHYLPAALDGRNLPQLLTTLTTLQPNHGSLQMQMIESWAARTQAILDRLPQSPKSSLC